MKRTHRNRLFLLFGLILSGVAAFYISYKICSISLSETPAEKEREIVSDSHRQQEEQNGKKSGKQVAEYEPVRRIEHEEPGIEIWEKKGGTGGIEDIETGKTSDTPPVFILRLIENSVIVFYGDGVTMYENTGIKGENLPNSIRKELALGKPVYTFDELYSFLENYSS